MVSVWALTARTLVPGPTLTVAGAWPQPEVVSALQVAAFTTATRSAVVVCRKGTYSVRVAGLSTGGPGAAPTAVAGGVWAQPVVWVALQVAVLITKTVPLWVSAAYRVWVASSTAPTSAGAGISATGAHPDRSLVVQVAPLITSI